MGSLQTTKAKAFPPGIHVPSLTWFANDATQEIDWDLQEAHLKFLISSGLDGSTLNPLPLALAVLQSLTPWLQLLSREQTAKRSHYQ